MCICLDPGYHGRWLSIRICIWLSSYAIPLLSLPNNNCIDGFPLIIDLFLSAFQTQVPIIHAPTWQHNGNAVLLLGAAKACGALSVKTKNTTKFIVAKEASLRRTRRRVWIRIINDRGRVARDDWAKEGEWSQDGQSHQTTPDNSFPSQCNSIKISVHSKTTTLAINIPHF